MAVYYHKRPIVKDGLIFQEDYGNKLCYVSGSNTTNIVNPTSPQGALQNGAVITNGSLVLDGVDDYINYGNQYNFGTTDHSVQVWFRNDDTSDGFASLLNKTSGGNNNWRIYTVLNALIFGIQGELPSGTNKISVSGIVQGQWHLATCVYDKTGDRLRVALDDGAYTESTAGIGTPVGTSLALTLGSSLLGEIGYASIQQHVLTEAEKNQNYEAQKHRYL